MGLATIDPRSHKEHSKIHKIPKFTDSYLDPHGMKLGNSVFILSSVHFWETFTTNI